MNKRFEFYATAKTSGGFITIDREGAAKVVLEAPADQIAEVLKLAAFGRDALLRVTIEVQDDANAS